MHGGLRNPIDAARLIIVCLTGLAALLVIPAAALAKPQAPPAPQLDTATATGQNTLFYDFSAIEIEVDAHSGPSGENPGGTVSFVIGNILPISGPVTCLDVSGNTATMTVSGPFPMAPHFTSFIVRLEDNGGDGLDRFEFITNDPFDPDPEVLDCRLPPPDYFGGLLTGRALVGDVDPQSAVPTSKRQCKRGGYAQFGFKNQGRCIRYVVHHRHHGGG